MEEHFTSILTIVKTVDHETTQLELISTLLESRDDQQKKQLLSEQDEEGNTSLHVAARKGLSKCTLFLIENGAIATIANHKDQLPASLAQNYDIVNIIKDVEEYKRKKQSLDEAEATLPLATHLIGKQFKPKEGWLFKAGKKIGKWQRRYVVLSFGVLMYFAAKEKASKRRNPNGFIAVKYVESVDIIDKDIGQGNNFAFSLCMPERTFIFHTVSENDCSSWTEAIIDSIKLLNPESEEERLGQRRSTAPKCVLPVHTITGARSSSGPNMETDAFQRRSYRWFENPSRSNRQSTFLPARSSFISSNGAQKVHSKFYELNGKERVVYEGYVKKVGGNNTRKWQKRWLVLSKPFLIYYGQPGDKKAKGVIPLSKDCLLETSKDNHFSVTIPGNDVSKKRTFHFQTENADDYNIWSEQLRVILEKMVAIDKLATQPPPPKVKIVSEDDLM